MCLREGGGGGGGDGRSGCDKGLGGGFVATEGAPKTGSGGGGGGGGGRGGRGGSGAGGDGDNGGAERSSCHTRESCVGTSV